MKTHANIDEYISVFPPETQVKLQQVREVIRTAAPGAVETISYGMPAFKFHGMLVWFAAYKSHIGFYPKASGIATFSRDLSGYKSAKGSVQFPLDKPLPLALISAMVEFRFAENMHKKTIR
jgi:uncharacterized protein YdhG (YjbR/CyaY superfamily)